MKLTMKHLLLSLGTAGAVAAPVAAVVACGNKDDNKTPAASTATPAQIAAAKTAITSAQNLGIRTINGATTVMGVNLALADAKAAVTSSIASPVVASDVAAEVAAANAALETAATSRITSINPTVAIDKDLSQGNMGIWHAVTGGNGTAQIADGTIIGFKDGAATYSVAFDKAKFDDLKTASKASVSNQAKDFFFAIAAAVAGTWDQYSVKVAVKYQEAIVKSTFTTVWTAANAQGGHGTTSAQAEFDALKLDLNGVAVQTSVHARPQLSAGTVDLNKGMDSWHNIVANGNGGTQIADGTKVGFEKDEKIYEVAFTKATLDTLKAKIVTSTTSPQAKDFFVIIAAAVAGSMDEAQIIAALNDQAKSAIIEEQYELMAAEENSVTTHAPHATHATYDFGAIKTEFTALATPTATPKETVPSTLDSSFYHSYFRNSTKHIAAGDVWKLVVKGHDVLLAWTSAQIQTTVSWSGANDGVPALAAMFLPEAQKVDSSITLKDVETAMGLSTTPSANHGAVVTP